MAVAAGLLGLLVACGGGAGPAADGRTPPVAPEGAADQRIVVVRALMRHEERLVTVLGVSGAVLYAVGHDGGLVSSDDHGDRWQAVDPPWPHADDPPRGLVFKGAYTFAYTKGGRVLRTRLGVDARWRDVSVPRAAVPFLPEDTQWRPDVLAASATHLFYGNYSGSNITGARVYRSADDGASWHEVLHIPEPQARHVHAVRVNPRDPHGVFVSIGDLRPGATGAGLYYSAHDGQAGSYRQLSSRWVGINLAFPARADRLFLEGDGPMGTLPLLLSFPWSSLDGTGGAEALKIEARPPEGWGGSAWGIAVAPSGDLVLQTNTEGGALGTREGIWLLRRPDFRTPVLIEDVTQRRGDWAVQAGTHVLGPYLFTGSSRLYVSDAQDDCSLPRGMARGSVRHATCLALRGGSATTAGVPYEQDESAF